MTRDGKLRLGTFIHGLGLGNWQDPEVPANATVNIDWLVRTARLAERGLFDFAFIADSPYATADAAWRFASRIEPLVSLGAVARETRHIGVVGTATTSFAEPYTLARLFATLDLVSNGRAGWNVVTSTNLRQGLNYSADRLPEHEKRYEIASEFIEVVRGLWGSWDEDAIVRDKATGVYHDPEKVHELNHVGAHFQVKGPMNLERSLQGSPVVFQAGASPTGKAVAARHAEAVFAPEVDELEAGRRGYDEWKELARGFGRDPDELLVLPQFRPVVGRTREAAEERYQATVRFFDDDYALAALSSYFDGFDLSKVRLDGPFPEDILELTKNAFRSSAESLVALARREDLTIRQAAVRFLRGSREFVGPAEEVADKIEHLFRGGAFDGLILSTSPTNVELFIDLVVPILRQRGLFRERYEASTLRGLLDLPVPTAADDRRRAKEQLEEIARQRAAGSGVGASPVARTHAGSTSGVQA